MATRDFDELLIGPRPLAIVLGETDLRHRQPPITAVGVEDARARQAGLVRDDDEARRLARNRQARQIGPPILVRHHRQRGRPDHLDAGVAAGSAAGTICGNQVGRVPFGDFAGRLGARPDTDAAVGFLE